MNLQAHDQLKNHIWEIANRLRGPDLPLNFYPAATGVRLAFTPIGAG